MKSILANEFLCLIKLALNQAEKVLHYPNGGIWGCIQRLPSSNFHVNLYFPPFDTRAYKKKCFGRYQGHMAKNWKCLTGRFGSCNKKDQFTEEELLTKATRQSLLGNR